MSAVNPGSQARGVDPNGPTGAPSPEARSYADPVGKLYDATVGGLNSVYQGVTLGGGGDELAGGVAGLGSMIGGGTFKGGYEPVRDAIRARGERFHLQNPAADLSGQFAGGILTGAGAARAFPGMLAPEGASTLGNVARGAGTGAAAGATSGFLNAEGGPENRAQGAMGGGLFGGLLGMVAPTVAGIVSGLRGRVPPRVAGVPFEDRAAATYIGRSIKRDMQTPEELAAIARTNAASGKPTAIADVAGENVRNALDTAVNRPGPARSVAREFFRTRQTGETGPVGSTAKVGSSQAERLAGDVKETVSDASFYDSIDALADARKKSAAPLYDKAYSVGSVTSPGIQGLLRTPSGKAALERALRLAQDEAGGIDPAAVGNAIKARDYLEGRVNPGEPIPFVVLDYVKRGLDDVAESFRPPPGGQWSNEGRIAGQVRDRFRYELTQANPAYADALGAWSGPTQAMGIIRDGLEMFKGAQPEIIAKRVAKLSPQERELFYIGIARALTERIEGIPQASHNAAIRVLKGADAAKLLAAGLPKDRLASLVNSIEQEAAMYRTQGVMGGSQTAMRLASAEDMNAGAFEAALADRVTGQRTSTELVAGAIKWLRDRGSGIGNENVRTRIAQMLLDPNPAAQARALDLIARVVQQGQAAQRAGGALSTIQGAAIGVLTGREVGRLGR